MIKTSFCALKLFRFLLLGYIIIIDNKLKIWRYKMNCLTKKEMDNLSLENMDDSRKNQIVSIKNSIVLNYEGTLDFASGASKNLTEFSSDLLKTMKVKDMPRLRV